MAVLTGFLRQSGWPPLLVRLLSDRVVWALGLLVLVLLLHDPAQAASSLRFMLGSLLQIGPFLLLAVAIAGYAGASGADALIARAFSGHPAGAVVMASLVGALSPFCSCGVIPLIAAMLAAGVPLAPVMAFWIASPIMDPEMFILTAAGISLDFAIAKAIATVGMGLLAGFAVLGLQRAGLLLQPLSAAPSCCSCKPGFDPKAPVKVAWKFWREPARRRQFAQAAGDNGWFLLKWLALAFLIESLMLRYLPADLIGSLVGGDNWFAIPLGALVGIPSYLNGYAAIPMLSGLLDMGMSPGAAMAFITSGAVSSIPAAIAVWALVSKRVFAVYLALGLIGSMLAGYAYQFSGGVV